jgi:DNA mismatch endonuclease (patch repair protein)
MDHVSEAKRSEIMRAVKSRNTRPELAVRRMLSANGLRYRVHRKDLPGSPDIVFAGRRKVIFVHGCYWHGHARCKKAALPKSRVEFWANKVTRNKERDRARIGELKRMGWRAMVVWQCQLKNSDRLLARVLTFLDRE